MTSNGSFAYKEHQKCPAKRCAPVKYDIIKQAEGLYVKTEAWRK